MIDVIVVGAGIIGATVAKRFSMEGASVLNLDDRRPLSGTYPSGGHLKPSWFGDMKKAEYEPAMDLLDEVWGLKKETFYVWPMQVPVTVYRVDTDLVLSYTSNTIVNERVTGILPNLPYPKVRFGDKEENCKLLVVATGVWANELIGQSVKVQAKQGVSFRLFGRIDYPIIKPWSPYKQVVAHQQSSGEVWVGDGTAVVQKNWKVDQASISLQRCREATGLAGLSRMRMGLRPYTDTLPGEPCLLKQIGPRAWVATGAGKSGTIAAGWVARRLLTQLF